MRKKSYAILKYRKMHISFRVLSQIEQKLGGIVRRTVQIIIKGTVVQQKSHAVILRVQLTRHLLHVVQRRIHRIHGRCQIQFFQIRADIGKVSGDDLQIAHNARHILAQHLVELAEETARLIVVVSILFKDWANAG